MSRLVRALSGALAGGLFVAATLASAEEQSFVDTYETAAWTVGLGEFDGDGLEHETASIDYGNDNGLMIYCSQAGAIALRIDPFYPNGPTPNSNIRLVVTSGDKTIYDQTLGPFSFADNSYGGKIPRALAEAMKAGSRLELSDASIGLDKAFPLKGSSQALASLKCVG